MSALDIPTRYTVSRMDASHLDEVVELERLCSTNPWTAESFRHELETNVFSRPQVALTSNAPSSVAGYCVSWVVFEDLHVQNVAVHPEHRRVGLARHLLQCALDEGSESGADNAQLEVRRSNTAALRLYQSLGFEIVGERRDYYAYPREDAFLLRKEL